jgi:hypothetical protein
MAPTATTSVRISYQKKKTVISASQYEYEMWMMQESDNLNMSCIPEIR